MGQPQDCQTTILKPVVADRIGGSRILALRHPDCRPCRSKPATFGLVWICFASCRTTASARRGARACGSGAYLAAAQLRLGFLARPGGWRCQGRAGRARALAAASRRGAKREETRDAARPLWVTSAKGDAGQRRRARPRCELRSSNNCVNANTKSSEEVIFVKTTRVFHSNRETNQSF